LRGQAYSRKDLDEWLSLAHQLEDAQLEAGKPFEAASHLITLPDGALGLVLGIAAIEHSAVAISDAELELGVVEVDQLEFHNTVRIGSASAALKPFVQKVLPSRLRLMWPAPR
jgi:hypothetical protein